MVENAVRHSHSIKCLISGDGAVGGAVHLHCTCVVSGVEEMCNRLWAARSNTSAAQSNWAIEHEREPGNCVMLSFGVVTVQC